MAIACNLEVVVVVADIGAPCMKGTPPRLTVDVVGVLLGVMLGGEQEPTPVSPDCSDAADDWLIVRSRWKEVRWLISMFGIPPPLFSRIPCRGTGIGVTMS